MKIRHFSVIILIMSLAFTLLYCSGGNTNNNNDNNTNQEQNSNENNTTNNNNNVDNNNNNPQDINNLDYNVSNDSSTEKEVVQLLEGLNEEGIIENYRLYIENLTEDLRYYKISIIEYENIELTEEVYIFSSDTNEIYEIDFPVIDIKLPSMIKYEWKASLSEDNLDE